MKMLLMGLGESGKSSIKSVVFDGKKPTDVSDYHATIEYLRYNESVLDENFQIFDCGGQENFLDVFMNKQAPFIFSNVKVFVWVVDTSDFSKLSKSRFYFQLAIKEIDKYSPSAKIFCLFHKMDLILPEKANEIIKSMKSYFVSQNPRNITYYSTSIFTEKLFSAFGNILQALISESTVVQNVSHQIKEFIQANYNVISGITIYTDEGLPIIEEGELTDILLLPANFWLTNIESLKRVFINNESVKGIIEIDDYILYFKAMRKELLLSAIAKRSTPLPFVSASVDSLEKSVGEFF
jgi:GTPase SAR1 family protein